MPLQVTSTFSFPAPVAASEPLLITPDSSHVAWKSDPKTLQVLDVGSGEVTSSPSKSRGGAGSALVPTRPRAISPDGNVVVEWELTQKRRVKVWTWGPRKFASKSYDLGLGAITAATLTRDGCLIVGDEDGQWVIASWDGQCLNRFSTPPQSHGTRRLWRIWALGEGTLLVAGSAALYRYSPDGSLLGQYAVGPGKAYALSADETTLAVGHAVGMVIHLVDLQTGAIRELPLLEADVFSLAFTSDGRRLFAATKGGWTWAVLDVESGGTLRSASHTSKRGDAMLHPKSGFVLETRDKAMHQVDVDSGDRVALPVPARASSMGSVARGPAFLAFGTRMLALS